MELPIDSIVLGDRTRSVGPAVWPAYVVVADTGRDYKGQPDVYGPFDAAEADAFAETVPIEPFDGGYCAVTVIVPGERHMTPAEAWWLQDEDADEDELRTLPQRPPGADRRLPFEPHIAPHTIHTKENLHK